LQEIENFRQTIDISDEIPTDNCEFLTEEIIGAYNCNFTLIFLNKVFGSKFCIFGRKFSDKKFFRQFFYRRKFKGFAPRHDDTGAQVVIGLVTSSLWFESLRGSLGQASLHHGLHQAKKYISPKVVCHFPSNRLEL